MKTLRGKRVLVTGAASGIGRALALEFARRGADLRLLDIDEAGVESVAAEVHATGHGAIAVRVDLSRPEEIHQAAQRVLADWGGLDLLVNNAGVLYIGPTDEMSREQLERVLAINLYAPVHLTRELLPALLASGDAHILNVASLAGLVGAHEQTAYTISKAALVRFSESLRLEYAGRGMGVTALCPGFVRTNLHSRVMTPGERFEEPQGWIKVSATPERIARAGVEAVLADRPIAVGAAWAHGLWLLQRLLPGVFHRIFALSVRPSRVNQPATRPEDR